MISFFKDNQSSYTVRFESKVEEVHSLFSGKYLETFFLPGVGDQTMLYVGLGDKAPNVITIKELIAKAVKVLKEKNIYEFQLDLFPFIRALGNRAVGIAVEGIYLGDYETPFYGKKERIELKVNLIGIGLLQSEKVREELSKGITLGESIVWARDMVNMPGNKLRPMDFARDIMNKMEDTAVECEVVVYSQLCAMGMRGITSIGCSSDNPPCFMILRYLAAPDKSEITGLVGKGVTCDTGGYCLKAADSMMGIKGDMAGGAAVAGAIYALAKNKVKTNVIGFIPMCENRISSGSLVPGDVITSYSGRTIEICNTDAEGRLILADAVSYAVQRENVTRVLDVATLTGAVVNMFGFSTAGAISDNNDFYHDFEQAFEISGERYYRLPIYEEQERMIESKIADIKNMGESHCGTITAGLFIKAFAEERPWIHLDIAGTAWVDKPVFEYQSKGATGAGVTTLYYLAQP